MRKSTDFIDLASNKRFENCIDRLVALYNESQDLGSKTSEIIIPMQEMVIRNINARTRLAKAVDRSDFEEAIEAEKELTKIITEVKLFLHEVEEAWKTE